MGKVASMSPLVPSTSPYASRPFHPRQFIGMRVMNDSLAMMKPEAGMVLSFGPLNFLPTFEKNNYAQHFLAVFATPLSGWNRTG
jgi:hypothetical protein